jgi:DNA-binding MarR family transcriptional regulator
MSDATNAPTTTATPAEAAPKKSPAKRAASNGLSPQRAALVKALRKNGGSVDQLAERSKLPPRAVYHHLWHLRNDGFVRSFDLDDDSIPREVRFELTAKGKKL